MSLHGSTRFKKQTNNTCESNPNLILTHTVLHIPWLDMSKSPFAQFSGAILPQNIPSSFDTMHANINQILFMYTMYSVKLRYYAQFNTQHLIDFLNVDKFFTNLYHSYVHVYIKI